MYEGETCCSREVEHDGCALEGIVQYYIDYIVLYYCIIVLLYYIVLYCTDAAVVKAER